MNVESTLPPKISRIYEDSHRLWLLALLTPVVYLLIGKLLAYWDVVEVHSTVDMDPKLIAEGGPVAALGAIVLAGVLLLRWRRQHCVKLLRDNPALAIESWRRRFFFMGAFSDLLGMLGLVLFFASGETVALLGGGVMAYAAYAISYPMRSELQGLDDPEDMDETE